MSAASAAAALQNLRECRRERRAFDQFALLQIRVGSDDPLTLTRKCAPSVHEGRHRFDGDPNGLDRGKRRPQFGEGPQQLVLQRGRATEEYLALVRIVPEERPLSQSGALRNVGDGDLIVSVSEEEFVGRLLEATAGVGAPSAHSLYHT
jgi:hypothetical protein